MLTKENHERVLAAAVGKKTEDVKMLAASLAPQPDVPAWIRKLPKRNQAVVGREGNATDQQQLALTDSASSVASNVSGTPNSSGPASPGTDTRNAAAPAVTTAAPAVTTAAPAVTTAAETAATTQRPHSGGTGETGAAAARTSNSREPAARARRERATIAPLRENRFKVQFSASAKLRDKLRRAEELLGPRHAGGVAKGDIASVVERALDELIEVLEKKRFAKTPRPQKKPRARKPGTRYVPREVRREVADRDGGRCTFVDSQQRRCEERSALEFHHRHAFALGGEATAANVTLHCRSHNALEAERDFGAEHMERALRRKDAPPRRDEGADAKARPSNAALTGARPPIPLHVRDGGRKLSWTVGVDSLRGQLRVHGARGEQLSGTGPIVLRAAQLASRPANSHRGQLRVHGASN